MSRTEIYWLRDLPAGRLAVMPRPRGDDWLDDEVADWQRERVDVVVSLLESHEVKELGLREEAELCDAAGIELISFPVVDRGVPKSAREVSKLVDHLILRLREDSAVAIHCRAGIGRSALLAACVLSQLGMREGEVFRCISRARGVTCPDTEAQIEWFKSFARGERDR